MWTFFVTMAAAAPPVAWSEDESSWPSEHRGAVERAVAKCVGEHPWVGPLRVTLGGELGAPTVELQHEDFFVEEIPPQACLVATLSADPAVRAAEDWWWGKVDVGVAPEWLAAVTVAGAGALDGAVRERVALCAASRAFRGSLSLEVHPGEDWGDGKLAEYQSAWPTPYSTEGRALADCVRGRGPGAPDRQVALDVFVHTPKPPARAPVSVEPATADVPPKVLEVVRDAAAQCVAEHEIRAPFDLALSRTDGQLGGAVVSMAEGTEQPSNELGMCLMFGRYPEIGEGRAFQFRIGPAR